MKANRKIRMGDDAVSPVIAVILMVAITVVLAATVYVWVSSFGASGSQSKNLSAAVSDTANNVATISIVSVASNFAWSNLKITVDGPTTYGIAAKGVYVRDAAWTSTAVAGNLAAADTFKVAHRGSVTSMTLRFVDVASNSVVSSLTVNVAGDTTVPTASGCTKADPSVLTFSELGYTTSTWSAPNTLFVFTEVSGDGDALGATALSYTNGFSTMSVDMTAAPDATDTMGPHGTNKIYDLAGNAWAAACTYA